MNEDVLVDLFETILRNGAAHPNDVSCFQSTQVSRSDVPGDTVAIKPDFPLSPLHCAAAPVVPANNAVFTSPWIDAAAVSLCSEPAAPTATAAQSQPTTVVVTCTEAHLRTSQSSDVVTFPSVVYDRVRNLFCASDSEVNSNSSPDKLPCSSSSDAGQQNRRDGELVTGASEVIRSTAVTACNSDSSPLESSYVDAGRMAYTESDVNVLAKVSVVSATEVPVVTSCIDSSPCQLRIENVHSLCNVGSPDAAQSVPLPCQETCVKDSFPSSSFYRKSKRAVRTDQYPSAEKSPADVNQAGFKRKLSSRKDESRESDALFTRVENRKSASKKRRLYKPNMLTEDMFEKQHPEHLNTSGSIVARTHVDRNGVEVVRDDNLPACETVMSERDILPSSAAVTAPRSLTASSGETANNPPPPPVHDCISDVITSSQNLVDATGVEPDAARVAKPSNISSEQQTLGVKRGRIVAAETNHELEMERGAAAVVSASAASLPVPSDGLCAVSASVAGVSSLNPALRIVSAEWPRSLDRSRSSQILAGEKAPPSDRAINKLLSSAERRKTDIASARDDGDSPLCVVAEVHGNDTAITTNAVDTATSSGMLPAVDHSSSVRRTYSGGDPVPEDSGGAAAETGEVPDCVTASLPADDTDRHRARRSRPRSKSLEQFGARSSRVATDLRSVSFDSTVDASSNERRKLSRKKSMTTRARRSITDQNKNIVSVVDQRCLSSKSPSTENTSHQITSQNADRSGSPSLLCAQKQSYCLPPISASACRLSAIGTPFLPSHSCSQLFRECCRAAEESLGYRPPSTTADDIVPRVVEDGEDQMMQSENRSPAVGLQPGTTDTEQASRVLPAVSVTSDAGTVTDPKQPLSGASNGSGKLTSLPTPKNSLTCYQPLNRTPSPAPAAESSSVSGGSQCQPNYAAIQVLIFCTFEIYSYCGILSCLVQPLLLLA